MSLYSSYWYRVAHVIPRLQNHVNLFKHKYRNHYWYILQDSVSGRQHRFSAGAYRVIGLMDGQRTVQQIWEACNSVMGDESPTQDEIISLLGRLHSIDLLQSDALPDELEILARQKRGKGKWKDRLKNPLAPRLPLVDPDRFLSKWVMLIRPCVSWIGAMVWLLVVFTGFVLAAVHWPDLTNNIGDRVLAPANLFLLWLVYPVVKLLHELGHAFLIKHWKGEVHEMGIMLLAFTPIPYVNASSSSAFTEKYKRIAVAGAGMAIELFVAALALFLWLNVEEGRVSAIAYNVMLIGGVSTILFNGNPLLRFDGYYILADLIEVPNLATRSRQYLAYLLQRYPFGIKEIQSPVTAVGEEKWFFFYGIVSFCYRISVLAALALFVGSKFPFLGVAIAVWALLTQIFLPFVRSSNRFLESIRGRLARTRVLATSFSFVVLAVVILFVFPIPLTTKTEGYVSLPEFSKVRAGTACVIKEVLATPDSFVEKDEPLMRCEDPFLEAEVKVIEADLEEAMARLKSLPLKERVAREIVKEELKSITAALNTVKEERAELIIRSDSSGRFVVPGADSLPGLFVEHGGQVGYVIGDTPPLVTTVVRQQDIQLVRGRTAKVELRLISEFNKKIQSSIEREVPTVINTLPSKILGTEGGGKFSVDPADPEGLRSLENLFQLEIKLPLTTNNTMVGQRVHVLFDHGKEPIAYQWYRSLKQLFLHFFNG